jgi:hypothetical protein
MDAKTRFQFKEKGMNADEKITFCQAGDSSSYILDAPELYLVGRRGGASPGRIP